MTSIKILNLYLGVLSKHNVLVFEEIYLIKSFRSHFSFQTFESTEDNDKRVHLYQVVKGISRLNYAFEIGEAAGFSDEIIDRAKEVSSVNLFILVELRNKSSGNNHLKIIIDQITDNDIKYIKLKNTDISKVST